MPPKRTEPPTKFGRGTEGTSAAINKTERSHEENQERAYIAASRRSDRSIDARLQSARMASQIHKQRTGKGFRISEEIVRREEMYEEEEDDLPRSYRILNPHMQTDSPEFNARIEAWMSNKLAMTQYVQQANERWNDNPINRLFAQSFPQASQQAQQLSHQFSMSGTTCAARPQSPHYAPQSPMAPTQAHQTSGYESYNHNRSLSATPVPAFNNLASPPASSHDGSNMTITSPPSATSGPMSPSPPPNSGTMSPPTETYDAPMSNINPSLSSGPMGFGQGQSAFSAALPAEFDTFLTNPNMTSQYMGMSNWNNMGNNSDPFMTMDQANSSVNSTVNKLGEVEYGQPTDDNDLLKDEEPAWDTYLNMDTPWANEQ